MPKKLTQDQHGNLQDVDGKGVKSRVDLGQGDEIHHENGDVETIAEKVTDSDGKILVRTVTEKGGQKQK